MFPKSFSAKVAERMAIWGFMLGFLLLLYGTTAVIESWQTAQLSIDEQRATAAALAHLKTPAVEPIKYAEKGSELVGVIEAIHAKEAELSANYRQNKILLVLLALFIVGQIVVMEYRLLISPIVRMAALLQSGTQTPKQLAQYARRRDEIGVFAQALTTHFLLVRKEQQASVAEQVKLSGRLQNQEQFRRESMSFQNRIAGIVQNLESNAARMSNASENLASISSEADVRAGATAQ